MREILRINKQEEVLDTKEKKMIENSLNSLDELDAFEAKEKKAEEERVLALEQAGRNLGEAEDFLASPNIDPAAFSGLPDSFWAGIGFPETGDLSWSLTAPAALDAGGGSSQASQGS
jgi:hypothetical protein